MSFTATPIGTPKAGTCPHGLPLGACPICNGMGGGATATKRQENKPKEMSYDECYAVWQMMKAQKAQALANKELLQNQAIAHAQMQQNLISFGQKALNILSKIESILPRPIAKVTSFITQKLANFVNTIKEFTNNIQNKITDFKTKILDIADKLSAVFGEKINAMKDNLKKNLTNLKKKFLSFLFSEDENLIEETEKKKKLEEKKKIFKTKEKIEEMVKKEVEEK